MTEEQANAIIKRTMSSESWRAEVARFPKEWQSQVESAMAKSLGHGLNAASEASRYQVCTRCGGTGVVVDRGHERICGPCGGTGAEVV